LTIDAHKPIIQSGELTVFDKSKKKAPASQRDSAPRRKLNSARGWSKIDENSNPDAARVSMAAPARTEEQPCPNCGQPMLAAWGSTCGNCRPRMAAPKTVYMSAVDSKGVAVSPGLCLGWFVVLSSADTRHNGSLLELTTQTTILSRGAQENTSIETWIDFNDKFISNCHALIFRPKRAHQDEAFTIRDRELPGPSANGTFVNSHKLAPGEIVELSEGDIVRVGRTELMFRSLWLSPSGKVGT
jgi:hypothetical protein